MICTFRRISGVMRSLAMLIGFPSINKFAGCLRVYERQDASKG